MSTAPLTTPDETARHRAVLNAFVDLGHDLAQLVVEEAKAKLVPAVKAAKAFDMVTRSARRSILLIHEVLKFAQDRVAARKQIIRQVEDSIQRHPDAPSQRTLHREMLDRLDSLDLEADLATRPLEHIITDMLRDLGLAAGPGYQPWKRRTPTDVATLARRAAQPQAQAQAGPRIQILHPPAQASPAVAR